MPRERALSFFGYLAEVGGLDLWLLFLSQRLYGLVVYLRAGDLCAAELGFGLEVAVEAEPHEIIGIEDHLVIIPALFAVNQLGDSAYLGALTVLVLARSLLGLGVVELLVPLRADITLLALSARSGDIFGNG
jgi:hypothetical protein